MSMTGRTAAENLSDLLVDVAMAGAEFLEAFDASGRPASPEARARFVGAIDAYNSAVAEHEASAVVLERLRRPVDRVWTMEEIAELKRRNGRED